MNNSKDNGYIIEFRQVGDYVKVSAIDPVSYKEVSIIGSPKLTRKQLSEMAVKKLLYVLGKSKEMPEEPDDTMI